MPTLDQHQSQTTTKLLLEGDSGAGKTGALVSLILAGYNMYVFDFDNGFDIVRNILRQKKREDLFKKVDVYTLTDPMISSGVHLVPSAAQSWSKMVELMGNWPGIGPIQKLGPQDILVLDSLNFAGRAAMRHVAKINARLTVAPQIQDYFDAQRMIENLCAALYDSSITCNVIVLTHLREISKTQQSTNARGQVVTQKIAGTERMLPETGAGQALSPIVGRFFNAVLLADIVGQGSAARRIIRTEPHENIGLKNPAPGLLPRELPLDTGLAQYFAAVRGESPAAGVQAVAAAEAQRK